MTFIFPDDLFRVGVGVGIVVVFYILRKMKRPLFVSEWLFLIYLLFDALFYLAYYSTNRFTTNEVRAYLGWLPPMLPLWAVWALVHYFYFRGYKKP